MVIKTQKNCTTSEILQEVAVRLSTHGSLMGEEDGTWTRNCWNHVANLFNNIPEKENKPNDASILFAVTDYILVQFHACAPYVIGRGKEWPCNMIYSSEVHAYRCRNHVLEMSIMTEKDVNVSSILKYCYICFSFPEGKHIYHVEEVPTQWIPTLLSEKEEIDRSHIQCLFIAIGHVFDSFCFQFVGAGKFRTREFSMSGIEPTFSETECSSQPPKKRRKITRVSSYDEKKFKTVAPSSYTYLLRLFQGMDSKPDAHSRLFAFIHEILITVGACKTSLKKDEWPGGPNYDSEVVQVWFPSSESAPEVQYCVFNLSILKNEKEFYCCVRDADDYAKKCIKKLDSSLAPTFDAAEEQKDAERFSNLSAWLSALIKTFVKKVIAGSYSSRNISFVSLASTTCHTGDATPAEGDD